MFVLKEKRVFVLKFLTPNTIRIVVGKRKWEKEVALTLSIRRRVETTACKLCVFARWCHVSNRSPHLCFISFRLAGRDPEIKVYSRNNQFAWFASGFNWNLLPLGASIFMGVQPLMLTLGHVSQWYHATNISCATVGFVYHIRKPLIMSSFDIATCWNLHLVDACINLFSGLNYTPKRTETRTVCNMIYEK